MNKKRGISVDDAYSVETPRDNIRLYANWADTYDTDFVAKEGYVYHLNVTRLLVRHRTEIDGALLDVGCGTGIVGVALSNEGFDEIDGIDISPQMLVEARKKLAGDGKLAYRNLLEADLTKQLNIPSNAYAGLISVGTFTHGHLGPDSLEELWRVGATGAVCVIGINAAHYESMGFGRKLKANVANGTITNLEQVEVNIYSTESDQSDHANDKALVVMCRIA